MICLNLAVSYNMRLNESMHVYIIQGSEPVGPIHLFKHYVLHVAEDPVLHFGH